ncbi:hypothetical protein [Pseudomonas sp. A-RE-19]|uniref:hypothetical protein n=1 Tax=Pseudomonas sp. A-RE-19 TaxID=2832401 RepID=UPI001CC0B04A|nr:hypothetical protein [Pseudomonas sp. A-RE-19]
MWVMVVYVPEFLFDGIGEVFFEHWRKLCLQKIQDCYLVRENFRVGCRSPALLFAGIRKAMFSEVAVVSLRE